MGLFSTPGGLLACHVISNFLHAPWPNGYRSILEDSLRGIVYGWTFVVFRIRHFYCVLLQRSHAEHLFFPCLFAKSGIDWIQSQLFLAAPPASSISLRQMTKVLVLVLMKLSLFSGFSLIFSLCWNTGFGPSEMIFTLVLLLQALLVFWRAWRFVFVFT